MKKFAGMIISLIMVMTTVMAGTTIVWATDSTGESSTATSESATTATTETTATDATTETQHTHSYVATVKKKATCKTTGITVYTCACGKSYQQTTKKTGHTYKMTTIRKRTCRHSGKYRYKCTVCGKKYYKTIGRKAHHPKIYKKKYYCKVCGKRIKKMTKAEKCYLARDKAVQWAIKIANDNSFHYGKSEWAHHSGCYYCGTNTSSGSLKLRDGATKSECAKTYCCNPFVTAAFYHGAGTSELNCKVSSKRVGLSGDSNKALKTSGSFKQITKPSKPTDLVVGDILLTPTHAMLYAGNGKVVHAQHHDNGVKDSYWNESIVYGNISDYQWGRVALIYRYYGTGRY